MLGRNDLEALAKIKALSYTQIEKDYLQNLFLYLIYSAVGKELIFKGGTCLYKLHSLNRFSEDLDFSVSKHFSIEKDLKKIFFLLGQTGVSARIKNTEKYHNQVSVNVEFKGPFFDGRPRNLCIIRLDISLRGPAFLQPERKSLHSIYSDIPSFDVFAMDLKEILAEKALAICTRKKARDVYDFWFLLTQKNVKIDFDLLKRKFKKHKKVFEKKELFTKIEEKETGWKREMTPLISGILPTFEQIKKEISDALEAR